MTPEVDILSHVAEASHHDGLDVVLSIGVSIMLFVVIRWVLGYFKQASSAMANIINVTLVHQTAVLSEIKTAMMAQNEWAREAVKRMREEHEQLLHAMRSR